MTTAKSKPGLSPAGARTAAARRERLAAALRENLKKRKAQRRERDEAPETAPQKHGPSGTSGGA